VFDFAVFNVLFAMSINTACLERVEEEKIIRVGVLMFVTIEFA
jgi:hypothetical protein